MRIWTEIAYCRNQSNKDLGFYYNEIKNKYKSKEYKNDWICLLDHDARFLLDSWYTIMEKHILESGNEYKLFSCLTNRVANKQQCVQSMWAEDRNSEHKKYAESIKQNHKLLEMPKSKPISGVLLLFPTQIPVKFREGGKCLGVDNNFHYDIIDARFKAGLMMDLYVYHWYRFDTSPTNINHLQ